MSVRMRHDGVEGEITVAESAVPFHAAAGWTVVEDDSEQAAGATSGGEQSQGKRSRASAAKVKEQD